MEEHLNAPNHRDTILTALSKVPAATAKQIAHLNQSLDPYKKACSILRDLETDNLVQWEWYRREKLWRLSKKGRKLMKCTLRSSNDVAHMLAVGNLYFTTRPKVWMYEPAERFGKLYWKPDCVLSFQKRLYVAEVQLSPLSSNEWAKKWNIFNLYFNEGNFHMAKFQQFAKSPPILPEFIAITTQQPETVKSGFNVRGRELLVVKNIT